MCDVAHSGLPISTCHTDFFKPFWNVCREKVEFTNDFVSLVDRMCSWHAWGWDDFFVSLKIIRSITIVADFIFIPLQIAKGLKSLGHFSFAVDEEQGIRN